MDLKLDTELNLRQAADLARCSEKTLTRRIADGRLHATRTNGRVVVTVGALVTADLYTLGTESASEASRANLAEHEAATYKLRCFQLENDLRLAKAERDAERRRADDLLKVLLHRDRPVASVKREVA